MLSTSYCPLSVVVAFEDKADEEEAEAEEDGEEERLSRFLSSWPSLFQALAVL